MTFRPLRNSMVALTACIWCSTYGLGADPSAIGDAEATSASIDRGDLLATFLAQRVSFLQALEEEARMEMPLGQIESKFEALQMAAERLSLSSEPIERSIITELVIPVEASRLAEDFLVGMAELRNGLTHALQDAGAASLPEQMSSVERWRDRTSATWEQQVQRAQQLSAESDLAYLDRPLEIEIPESASPAIQAFLAARAALANAHAQLAAKGEGLPQEMASGISEEAAEDLVARLHETAIQLSAGSEN